MDHNHHNHNGTEKSDEKLCCAPKHKKRDWLLLLSTAIIVVSYMISLLHISALPPEFATFNESIVSLINKMWWGILLGIFFVGFMDRIPQDLILTALGKGGSFSGLLRATAGGVLLDLCSHGILLVGMKLYQRGASLGQVMAFLIASPWNSISLTLILLALIGLKWTIAFMLFSIVIALISGVIFDTLVKKGVLPSNPNTKDVAECFRFWPSLKTTIRNGNYTPMSIFLTIKDGLLGSTMILRWIFFGTVLAALLQTFISTDNFQTFFGPTIGGLGLTLLIATIVEVCSEGSVPVAADLLTRAAAPGNAFAFLMTGVATDYTEILSLKETTQSWKISLFLPLITVPQVILIAMIINGL
ncbi:ATPase [Candidatus Peregrinibacteria bacterium CG10_big_fil_rev_8_21_14_0_10_42_8]|nr:MAG: ATPase [Candidatus Peregrinibacteria bacterium CG10_big_fil_rev_8_21_14_0_10_42_8]